MSESTALLDRTIADFAEAVRHNLADLPQDDIDDLTGGLEGDLAEQAIDQVGMFELGDPATYADELRSAAGLPERGSRGRAPRRSFGEVFREGRLAAAGRIRSSALGTWMLDFCVALAPVWWVARGWVGFVIVASLLGAGGEVLPQRPFNWLFLLGAIVVSVQWGRGRWLPVRWLNVVRTVASVVAIVAMPFVSGWALNELNSAAASNDAGIEIVPPGLNLDGKRVTNIFEGVNLFV